jgi:hypothetical protein
MSSPRKRLKFNKGERLPPFSPILYDEMDSDAYQELPGNAAKALPYFKRIHGRLKRKAGDNFNGIFDFTYSEAERFGFARRTFARIIADLHAKGFIDIVIQGGMRGAGMSNSKYRLSERWRDFGKKGFVKRPRYPSEPP